MLEKGREKTGGRQKGTVNKTTKTQKAKIQDLIDKLEPMVHQDLLDLEAKERVDTYIKLIEYVLPKLARTTLANDENNKPLEINVNFQNATIEDLRNISSINTEDDN
jgi:hypothetical protein